MFNTITIDGSVTSSKVSESGCIVKIKHFDDTYKTEMGFLVHLRKQKFSCVFMSKIRAGDRIVVSGKLQEEKYSFSENVLGKQEKTNYIIFATNVIKICE